MPPSSAIARASSREPPSLAATRKWRTRFVLLDLLYGLCWTAILIHPAGLDVVSNTLMMFLMLLVIAVSSMLAASLPIAALAATAPVTAAIALNFVLERHLRQLRARRCSRSPPKAISRCSPIACIRRRWRRWKRAPKRTR